MSKHNNSTRPLCRVLCLLSVLFGCVGLTPLCFAQETPYFGQAHQFEITPVRMMSDEQLIRSADFMRANRYATDQQLLNMMWLIGPDEVESELNPYVVMFKEKLEDYWTSDFENKSTFSRWLNLRNFNLVKKGKSTYKLKVGHESVALKYRFTF